MFRKNLITGFLLMILPISLLSQKKDPVLFSVAGNEIRTSEFTRVYEKNLELVTDPAQKDIENYLNLYINYKLKLQEAYDQHLDTLKTYQNEYTRYRNQLLDPYLKDENKEKDLMREAYERMQQEVSASHILLLVKSGQDTLKIYKRINAIRDSVLNGASFEKMARLYSDDKSAKRNSGNLGYFTVFDMVYPFESAVYNTPVGEISPVFRTRFGYHFVKVNDKRPSRGKVEVAHIMLTGKGAEKQAKNIKEELDKGADFAELARQYSQDKGSAKRGGRLAAFGVGKMVEKFDEVAFSLKNPGDISEPFKTRYGWHIVKLLKKYPIGTFEEEKANIEKKVKEGNRAKILGQSILNKLLKQYDIVEHKEWIDQKKPDAVILQINEKKIKADEFYQYQKTHPRLDVDKAFDNFKKEQVKEYYKEKLPEQNKELGYTLQEYREGLLLFELMKRKIWDYAEKDTAGLQSFFNKHRDRYKWDKRADVIMITCSKEPVAKKAMELLEKSDDAVSIRKELLAMNKGVVTLKQGKYERISGVLPKELDWNNPKPQLIKKDNQFIIIKVKSVLPESLKELNECKGKAISDYQDELEKEWIRQLRNKYPVHIDKKVLKKIKKKYK